MRHHLFPTRAAPPRSRETLSPATEPPRRPPPWPALAPGAERVDELRDLFAALRQAARMERVVRAAVVGLEPGERGDAFLMLGEREVMGAADPLRLKVRLRAGSPVAADALLNRDVTLRLRCTLRYGFGRGPRVQAEVSEVLAVAADPVEPALQRAETLRVIRAAGIPHGPTTWREPQDPRHIVLIASEHGEARRDVDQVLGRYVAAGALAVSFVPALFEGPMAERSLCEALARAAALDAAHPADMTLVVRGGGPLAAFAALDAEAVVRAAARLPNLVAGLGHAGTPETALDAVAGRSVATPTAAAVLVRDVLQTCAARAERALTDLDEAAEERVEIPARAALARAAREFDVAVDLCLFEAEARLAEVGRGVEVGLMGAIAALAPAGPASPAGDAAADGRPCPTPGVAPGAAPVLFEATPDGPAFIESATALRPDMRLTILLPDGAIIVRVERVTPATAN